MSTLSLRASLRRLALGDGPVRLLADLKLRTPVRLREALERLLAAPPAPPPIDLPDDVLELSVDVDELHRAVRERLAGGPDGPDVVVWTQGGSELVVYAESLQLRLTAGFLVAALGVEAAELPRCTVQLVFFLGTAQAGAGKAASVTMDGQTPALLAEAWGEALRAAVWEGVLDVLEGAAVAASEVAGVPLRVLGFTGGEDRVQLAVRP